MRACRTDRSTIKTIAGLIPASLLLTSAIVAQSIDEDNDRQSYSIRCDEQARLCWQDPQKDAYDFDDFGLVASEAARYCEELVLGDHGDWRLPTSDELRGLIAGNPATEPGGECRLTIGGRHNETLSRACQGRAPNAGPGVDGCYLASWLTGTCNKPGPPKATQALEVWASNVPSDAGEGWQAYVSFDVGSLGYNHKNSAGDVRCARDGLVPEQSGLYPASRFETRQHEIDATQDPCETSDKLALHISVPDELQRTPDRLMAFFYHEDKWRFPPVSPPDGGTDYNVLLQPGFDADGKITMLYRRAPTIARPC